MEFIRYPEIICAFACFLFLRNIIRKTLPTNWPIIGMLPAVLVNLHHLHDWVTEISSKCGHTFVFKGPWFTNMASIVVTSDPANTRYIFSTNFSNYPKGPEFQEFFDILGDGIVSTDFDSWKTQRKFARQLYNRKNFQRFLQQTTRNKVENGLIPVFEHVVDQNSVVDLQDVFKRFTFDTTTILFSGVDPGCLTVEFTKFPFVQALDDVEEAIFYRHVMPVSWWKLERWLGTGKEKKLSEAKECLDTFITQFISMKRREMKGKEERGVDLLTSYMDEDEVSGPKSDKFLRDTILTFMVGGRSTVSATLTWFFWLVSKNPTVETKLVEELKSKAISAEKEGKKMKIFNMEELDGTVFLHGALCEALRLFPSVPFEHKRPVQPDVLPSGHKVDPKTRIMPFLYAMGRMEEVWGKDCLEFKPERWISEEGGIKYVPSYKFMAFNSGPRTCLGIETAFTKMTMVAATLLYNYHVEVLGTNSMSPKNSIILYVSHGMKVRVKRKIY